MFDLGGVGWGGVVLVTETWCAFTTKDMIYIDEWRPILLRLRPLQLMGLIKFSYFLVYITGSVIQYIPFSSIYNRRGYIYHFLVYITGAVIYTIF